MRAEQPMSVRCALRWVQQRRKVVAGVLLVAVVGAVFLWPAQNQWDDAFSAMPSELNFIPRHQAAAAALPPSQRDLAPTGPGQKCSADRLHALKAKKAPFDTNCPDETFWRDSLIKLKPAGEPAYFMDIGCNKGYDFMLQYAFWGGVGRSKLESDFQQHATNLRHAPGVCNADDPAAEMRFVSAEKQRDVYGWCFEPTLSTMNAVNSSLASLGYLPPHVHTIRAAVSSSSGSILFPNPPLGVESAGLGTAKFPLVRTDIMTVDDLVSAHKIDHIDFLKIDAEGSDALVLLGSLRTLAAGRVSALSFEYNSRGHWKAANLEDTVDLLDHLSFDCYWTSNSGQLWRITGCWLPQYSQRMWSNLVCAHRGHPVAAIWEAHARESEIQ